MEDGYVFMWRGQGSKERGHSGHCGENSGHCGRGLEQEYGALGKASVKPKKRMALHGWKRNLVPGRLTKDYFLNHLQLQVYYILTFVCLCVLAELDHLWSSALAKMYGRFTNFSQQRIKYKIFTFFLSSLFVSIAPQHHLSESYLWYQILLDPNHIFFLMIKTAKGI